MGHYGIVYTRMKRKAAKLTLLRSSRKHIPTYASVHCRKSTRQLNAKKLDTDIFENYLEDLWSRISEKDRSSCAYLDCLWFYWYKYRKAKVLQWIKDKKLFSRKYTFVPIVCWRHWSLLILCHFGEKRVSKTKKRCMLLLDSLHKTDPKRLEPDIRRFVLDIFKADRRKDSEKFISEIPILIPKVPQQKNGDACGMYVLYFIYRFLQSAPDNFNLEGYPGFLNENWFSLEELENFQKGINSFRISQSDKSDSVNGGSVIPLFGSAISRNRKW